MNFQEKQHSLGFDLKIFRELEEDIADVLLILALVWPEKGHYFYQRYVEDYEIAQIAASCEKSTKTIQRGIRGKGDDLGAEDWFLIILQLFLEAEDIAESTASEMAACFTQPVSGADSLIGVPFHRGLFLALVESLVSQTGLRGLSESLPWSSTGSKTAARTDGLREIAWPAYRPPMNHNKLPGLLSVIRVTASEQRTWLCMIIVLLADYPDIWIKVLDVLNPYGPRLVARRKHLPDSAIKEATQQACSLLQRVDTEFLRYSVLSILANGPCKWGEMVDCVSEFTDLRQAHPRQRLQLCARKALAHSDA